MLNTCRLASYVPKGKEKQAMKQQKAMLIALIVICLTVIVTALVTGKTSSGLRYESNHQTEVAVTQLTNLRSCEDQRQEKSLATSDVSASSTHPHLTRFGGFFLF